MKVQNIRLQKFFNILFVIITVNYLACVPKTDAQEITFDRELQELLKILGYQYPEITSEQIDTFNDIYSLSRPALDQILKEYKDVFDEFDNYLLMISVLDKLRNAQDWEAFETVVIAVEMSILKKVIPALHRSLGWVSWIRTAMQLFKTFIFDPYLYSWAVDEYYQNRERLLEPDIALTTIRAEGNIRQQMLEKFREEHGDAVFEEITPSGLKLLPRWERNFDQYVIAHFENEYQKRKLQEYQSEAAEKIEYIQLRLSELERTIEEILAAKARETETLSIIPSDVILRIGESVDFKIIARSFGGEEIDVSQQASIESTSFVAESPGAFSRTAFFDGVTAKANITVVEAETEAPVSLLINPVESRIKPGESLTLEAIAIFADGRSTDVTTSENISWNPVSYFIAEEEGTFNISATYSGLFADAIVIVSEDEAIVCAENEVFDEILGDCVCADGFEWLEELNRCVNIDGAIADITSEDFDQWCDEVYMDQKLIRLRDITAESQLLASQFRTLNDNFTKVVNDKKGNACNEMALASAFSGSRQIAEQMRVLEELATSLSSELILEASICMPDDPPMMSDPSSDWFHKWGSL